MIDLRHIHSLTDFQRNAKKFLGRMKRSGRPEILTVNGKAELVVQDSDSYQQLLDALDRLEAIEGIKRGLGEVKRGKTAPAEHALRRIRRKHGIPRPGH